LQIHKIDPIILISQFKLFNWTFLLGLLNIILIDLSLSGDNAIVIAMAAATLPKARRKWAIVAGGGSAIVLRIGLTALAAWLMTIPLLSAAGGLVLVWVVYRLLKTSDESEEERWKKQGRNFRQAIFLILAADFMMSLDNILAVAGAANGDIILLIIGLLVSMPLLMMAGGAISLLIDRFRWLVLLGAFAISFSAVRMVFDDHFIAARFPEPSYVIIPLAVVLGGAITAFFWWLNRRRQTATVTAGDTPADK
jgi:YjbE family integral membrane protein